MRLSTNLEQIRGGIFACIRCSACTYGASPENSAICPLYNHNPSFTNSAGGLLYLARAILQGRMEFSQDLAELAYTCAACGACDSRCVIVRSVNPTMALSDMIRLIRHESIQHGFLPKGRLEGLYDEVKAHGDFAGDALPIDIPKGVVDNSADTLLIAQDVRWKGQAKPLADALQLLHKAGERIALLAHPGNSGSTLYDFGFWDQLAARTAAMWKKIRSYGAKSLVFIDPHCQQFLTKKSSLVCDDVGPVKGRHISEVLLQAFREGRLKSKANGKVKVAYHDPCRLGRDLGIYDAPRQLLSQLDGVELIEMKRSREQALCCGAGAIGNYFENAALATAKDRLGEFTETGADVLITACPHCKEHFGKALGSETHRVRDLLEFVAERTK